MIALKVELAKEKSLNKSLTEEMEIMRARYEEEIESMMATIDMQTKIINELTEKCDTVEIINGTLNQSERMIDLESDLLDSSWEMIDESVKDENVKMIVQLAGEVDNLTDKLNGASNELIDAKKTVEKLAVELEHEKEVKDEMLSVQADLARDILDLKVTHELDMGQARVQLTRQTKKNKKLRGKMEATKRGADDFIGTTKMLCEYDIIC